MNFSDILNLANSNTKTDRQENGKFFKTKFTAPKKESKDKKLSANIQKFLQKQEAEQISKAKEEKEKRDALLAMRDTKQKNKIRKMLKVIKSADKSVIADAKDSDNTAITLQGPDQPDNDDYGYESQEAKAFYSKLMQKYGTDNQQLSPAVGAKKAKYSIKETLQRTKSGLQEESLNKKKNYKMGEKPYVENLNTKTATNTAGVDSLKKDKSKIPKAPPLAFTELLKIAEKKQHEPIEISIPIAPKQEERLMSKKEKLEYDEKIKQMKLMKKRREDSEKSNKSIEIKKASKGTMALTPSKEIHLPKNQSPQNVEKQMAIKKSINRAIPSTSTDSKKIPTKEKTNIEITRKPSQSKPSCTKVMETNLKQSEKAKSKKINVKRRIEDYDSENDSEMDSFIDDGDAEDVSSYIKEIFGYDKSRYRDDDDDYNMESNFAQQMREESISKKIGLMEDLEDMKQEELAKKRKAMMKKKKKY